MKKVIITLFTVSGILILSSTCNAQKANVKRKKTVSQSALTEFVLKETGSTELAEQTLLQIRNYEAYHNVRVVTNQQYQREQATVARLEQELLNGNPGNPQSLQAKVSYIKNHIVRYADIKSELNK